MSGYKATDPPLFLPSPQPGGELTYQGGGKNCFNPLQPGFQGEKEGSSSISSGPSPTSAASLGGAGRTYFTQEVEWGYLPC